MINLFWIICIHVILFHSMCKFIIAIYQNIQNLPRKRWNYNDLCVSDEIPTLSERNVHYPLVPYFRRTTSNLRRDKKDTGYSKTHFVRTSESFCTPFILKRTGVSLRKKHWPASHSPFVESCKSWVVVVYVVYTRHSASAIRDSRLGKSF